LERVGTYTAKMVFSSYAAVWGVLFACVAFSFFWAIHAVTVASCVLHTGLL
jgi:hypothetical protein